jgi:hypothetical protein
MEERIMHEAPFCFLFVTALSLMLLSMVYAFDTEKMASVHRLLSDSVSLALLAITDRRAAANLTRADRHVVRDTVRVGRARECDERRRR